MNEDLIEIKKAGFEYVNPDAVVVIVGITPGKKQLEGPREGLTPKQIKQRYAFCGEPLHQNLIDMLNHVGINRLLGIETCNTLWDADFDKVEMTSLLKDAVFYEGHMFNKAIQIKESKMLTDIFNTGFVRDCALYSKAKLFVGLGKDVDNLLFELRKNGFINADIIGMPHPSKKNQVLVDAFLHPEDTQEKSGGRERVREQSINCISIVNALIEAE